MTHPPPRCRARAAFALLWLSTGCSAFSPSNAPAGGPAEQQKALASAPVVDQLLVLEGVHLRLHDLISGEVLAESESFDREEPRDVAATADGARFALSTWRGALMTLERRGAALVVTARVRSPRSFVGPPIFLPDGALAILARGRVDVWPGGDLRAPPVSQSVAEEARAIAFHPTEGHLAAAFDDHVTTWEAGTGKLTGSLQAPARRLVAYASNGSLATGSAPLVIRDPNGDTSIREEVEACGQLQWDGGGDHVACVGAEATWVCSRTGCEEVARERGAEPIRWVGPARDGFFFSSGDGRVVQRTAEGVRRDIIVDGVFDRPRSPQEKGASR